MVWWDEYNEKLKRNRGSKTNCRITSVSHSLNTISTSSFCFPFLLSP